MLQTLTAPRERYHVQAKGAESKENIVYYASAKFKRVLRRLVIIFEKIYVEDARNHGRRRRRDTARLTTNETALESA